MVANLKSNPLKLELNKKGINTVYNRTIFTNNKNENHNDLSLRLSFFCLMFFVALSSLFDAGLVYGQDYKSWTVDNTLSAKKDEIMKAMKQGNSPAANRVEWNAFFDKFYFARWTVEANLGFVQTYSRELLSRDLKEATGGARTFFLAKSLETLAKIANDKSLNPATRYNAILTIGQLASKETANNEPPAFYEDALKQLVAIHDNNATPEYIRVGALIGIVRHAQAGINNDDFKNNKVPAIFIKTIKSNSPAAEQDADERAKLDWSRIRAFDGLAALKVVNQNVITVVKDVIRSDVESFEMRCRAARLLGEIDLQSAVDKIKPAEFGQISNLLIALAKSYCDSEISKIDAIVNKAFPAGQPNNPAFTGRQPVDSIGGAGGTSRIGGVDGTGNEITEPPFASLPINAQREIISIVQRVKSNTLYFMLYGMRGPKLSGPTSTGIVSVLKAEDQNWEKLNKTTKSLAGLIEILDKGKPETTATGTARPTRPNPATRGQYKVNFTIIREALQKCSDDLNEIITGKKTEPAQPKT
ncbi:MAG: hypothetical protein LBT09_15260 [Planctomycetaceae bacterium]|nr:hypothetical protein [Planctomycetaceae bacterium]